MMMNLIVLLLSIALLRQSSAQTTYDVTDTRYKADKSGNHDSSDAFTNAWRGACSSGGAAVVYVPSGTFKLGKQVHFKGPCATSQMSIEFENKAYLVSSKDYSNDLKYWLLVEGVVDGLTISNGFLNGYGLDLWNCKKSGKNQCPTGATSLAIVNSNHIVVDGLKSYNSELFHIAVIGCEDVKLSNIKISAAYDSVNTDGIHLESSSGVTILSSNIGTGDDCVSLGPNTKNVVIEDVNCGPGHGISIGSLGQNSDEKGVENVVVKGAKFVSTQNGFRIKTWARQSNGYVNNVTFQDSIMDNALNPILIDQEYCPNDLNCPSQSSSSGVSISKVTYDNIRGSSASQVAVKFDCSNSKPCSDITLKDIDLTYNGGEAESSCASASGSASGTVKPQNCLTTP